MNAHDTFVRDHLLFKINGQRVAFVLFRAREKLVDLFVRKCHRQNSVFETIVVKNVRVTGRDNCAETIIADAPRRVFAARAAAEICARQQSPMRLCNAACSTQNPGSVFRPANSASHKTARGRSLRASKI